jgi:hypothetical protein
MPFPSRFARILPLAALLPLVAGFAPEAFAQSFGAVGARSVAMGGTGVALVNDATAVHFNPAALAFAPKGETAIVGGTRASESEGFIETIDDIGKTDLDAIAAGDVDETARLVAGLERLAGQDAGLAGGPEAGIFLTQNGGALSLEWQGWGLVHPIVDLVHVEPGNDPAVGAANNETTLALRGLETREAVLTYATQIIPGILAVGGNVKYVRGLTYDTDLSIFDLGDESRDSLISDALERNRTQTNRFSWDLGVLLAPISSVRIGATVRYGNSPRFDTWDGGSIQIERQIRAGIAFLPFGTNELALTADADVLQKDIDVGFERDARRYVGAGIEARLGSVLVRGGARTELGLDERIVVPTFGIGVGGSSFQLDLGAAWRADRDAEVAINLRWRIPG